MKRVRLKSLLRRSSDAVLLYSGAHGQEARSAPVLGKPRQLTHQHDFPNRHCEHDIIVPRWRSLSLFDAKHNL